MGFKNLGRNSPSDTFRSFVIAMEQRDPNMIVPVGASNDGLLWLTLEKPNPSASGWSYLHACTLKRLTN